MALLRASTARRRIRAAALLVALAALAPAAFPAAPAAGDEVDPGPSARPVVVRTLRSVHTTIRVEYPIEFSTVTPGAATRLRSTGKFSGFAIVDASTKKLALAGFRNEPCSAPKCDGWIMYFRRDGMITESGVGRLRPGTYELHVLSDGHLVEFVLRAPGVELVRPHRRHPSVVRDLDLQEYRSDDLTYAAGATVDVGSPALILASSRAKIRPFEAVDLGVCLFQGEPVDPALAYHSGCDLLGARRYGMLIRSQGNPLNSRADMFVPVLLSIDEGRWGLGAYSESVGVRRSVGSSALLLEL